MLITHLNIILISAFSFSFQRAHFDQTLCISQGIRFGYVTDLKMAHSMLRKL